MSRPNKLPDMKGVAESASLGSGQADATIDEGLEIDTENGHSKGNYEGLSARLATIGQAGRNGEMSSYGPNKDATLKKIVSMRKSQVEIFRKHMGLELSLSEKVDKVTEENEINSKKFSEVFQTEFHAKEKELESITTMLGSLSTVLSAVNRDTRADILPSEPGIAQQNKKTPKSFINQRNRNLQAGTTRVDGKDSEWKNKLALNPTRRSATPSSSTKTESEHNTGAPETY